jgi:hypothetical protein
MRPHRQAQPSGVDLSSESRIVSDAPASSSIVARGDKGYGGSDRLQTSKYLEQALGIITADHKTGEFYQAVRTDQHIQQ